MNREDEDQSVVLADLEELAPLAEVFAQASGPSTRGDDVLAEGRAKLAKTASRHPGFWGFLASMPKGQRWVYLRKVLRSSSISLARKGKPALWRPLPSDVTAEPTSLPWHVTAEDAILIIGKIRSALGPCGLFVLDMILHGCNIREAAQKHGFDVRTGRRWFAKGLQTFSNAVREALGEQLGVGTASEFLAVVEVYRQCHPELNVWAGQLQEGELAYRHRIRGLSDEARRVLHLFESGVPDIEIEFDVASRGRKDKSISVSTEDLLAARIRFVELVTEIRQAIDPKP